MCICSYTFGYMYVYLHISNMYICVYILTCKYIKNAHTYTYMNVYVYRHVCIYISFDKFKL